MRVMKDERGRSRGFGFVNFAHHDDAQKVLCVLLGAGRAAALGELSGV